LWPDSADLLYRRLKRLQINLATKLYAAHTIFSEIYIYSFTDFERLPGGARENRTAGPIRLASLNFLEKLPNFLAKIAIFWPPLFLQDTRHVN
jgi:hypothetical protein